MSEFIRASVLFGYRKLVEDLGGDPEGLLSQHSIDQSALSDPESTIAFRSYINLLEATASTLHHPHFGLELAKRQGFKQMGAVALVGLNSPSVGEALHAMLRFMDYHSPSTLSMLDVQTDPKRPRITFDFALTGVSNRRQVNELAMGHMYTELCEMTNSTFAPQAILFKHSVCGASSQYRRYFNAPVFFDQDINAIVVKPEDLDKKIETADLQLRKVVSDYLSHVSPVSGGGIVGQVKLQISNLLSGGLCGIREVAKNLGMNERTLQRRLAGEGYVFEELFDGIRRERAEELLKNSFVPIGQVAEKLGYSEQSSFTRVCVRWFKTTPTKVRKAARVSEK